VTLLNALGQDVEMVIKDKPRSRQSARIKVVAAADGRRDRPCGSRQRSARRGPRRSPFARRIAVVTDSGGLEAVATTSWPRSATGVAPLI
jgi:hypothetical protein